MNEKKLLIEIEKLFEAEGVKFKENSSGELIMDSCYNCGRSKKLYVSKETGAFICFRCNEKGSPVKLVAKYLNISFKEAASMLYGKDSEKIKASIKAVEEEEDSEPFILSLGGLSKSKKTTGDMSLPAPLKIAPELKLLTEKNTEAWAYLKKRGYTDEDIISLKLLILPQATFNEAWQVLERRIGKDNKEEIKQIARYHGRIVFPVYIDGEVMGFVARDYTGTKEPKVLNSSGNFRSFSVWNYDNAKNSETLIVCEGNSSAVKSGIHRSIALLGKTATPGQVRLIRKMKAKKIIICLDVGTEDEQIQLYKSFAPFYPGKIFKIEFPPVIELKADTMISEEFILEFNNKFKTDLTLLSPNLLKADLSNKDLLLNLAKINKQLPSDNKKDLMVKFMKKENLSAMEQKFIMWFLFKSEYKDAGDYSHAEMEDFINKATAFSGGPKI